MITSVKDVKILYAIKSEAGPICDTVEGEGSADMPEDPEVPKITLQFWYLIMCLQPLWLMSKPKTLYWDWHGNVLKGQKQRLHSQQKWVPRLFVCIFSNLSAMKQGVLHCL